MRSTCNRGAPTARSSAVAASSVAETARNFSSARIMLTPNSDSKKTIQGCLVGAQRFHGQTAKRRSRQKDVIEHRGHTAEGQQAAQREDGFAGAQLECPGHIGRRTQAATVQDAAFSGFGFGAFVSGQAQEAETHARFVMRGDECTLALAAQQHVLGGQFIDSLAHGALADLETGRQIDFAGDEFTRLPFAAIQALHQQVLDLAIERTESGARAGRTASGILTPSGGF